MTDRKFVILSRTALLARSQGNNVCLDNLICAELKDFAPAVPDKHKVDRVVWADGRLVAVIRKGQDGSAIVTRFED